MVFRKTIKNNVFYNKNDNLQPSVSSFIDKITTDLLAEVFLSCRFYFLVLFMAVSLPLRFSFSPGKKTVAEKTAMKRLRKSDATRLKNLC